MAIQSTIVWIVHLFAGWTNGPCTERERKRKRKRQEETSFQVVKTKSHSSTQTFLNSIQEQCLYILRYENKNLFFCPIKRCWSNRDFCIKINTIQDFFRKFMTSFQSMLFIHFYVDGNYVHEECDSQVEFNGISIALFKYIKQLMIASQS